jgi:hypothetical protein
MELMERVKNGEDIDLKQQLIIAFLNSHFLDELAEEE